MQAQDIHTCLVIGGAGFVGSAIADAAERASWQVTVATRSSYDTHRGHAFDVVINASGNAKRFLAEKQPAWDFEQSTAAIHRSLTDFRYRHYVLVSSVDVYNDPTSLETTRESVCIEADALAPYGFHKRLAELCVSHAAASWQIFRLGQMVSSRLTKGPIFDLIRDRPLWIDRGSEFPFLRTRTVADAVIHFIQHGPQREILNLCGRGQVSMTDALALWGARATPWADDISQPRQIYRINVDKAHSLNPLPDSRGELAAFFSEQRAMTIGNGVLAGPADSTVWASPPPSSEPAGVHSR